MNNRTTAVIFIGHVYPHGIVLHLAYLGIELYKVSKGKEFEFFFCSIRSECNDGAWNHLKDEIPEANIIDGADFDEVHSRIHTLFERFDSVLIHCGGGFHQIKRLIPFRRKYGSRLRVVVTTHSFQLDNWKRISMSLLQGILYRIYADHVIFQSPYTMRYFMFGEHLMKRRLASIIPLGVETLDQASILYPDQPLGNPDIRPLITAANTFNVVYLAWLREGKRHVWLVNALKNTLKTHDNIRLYLLGGGDQDRVIRDQIQQILIEADIPSDRVIIPGQISRFSIPWVLQHAQCAIVPSLGETFGHCFVEPMMAGIPVIGTRVGAGEYLIQDYLTGIGFDSNDDKKLAFALEFLYENPEQAKIMGYRAKMFVGDTFKHEAVAEAHARLYSIVLQK